MKALPDFTQVPWPVGAPDDSRAAWQARLATETGHQPEDLVWRTPEQIPVQALYTAEDLTGLEHLSYLPGLPPYLRGPYATMYVTRPWTVRQYAGFSTAEDSNAFYRRNLAAGQRACRSPSTWRPTADTTRTIRGLSATLAKPVSPSIPFSTWKSSSTASLSRR